MSRHLVTCAGVLAVVVLLLVLVDRPAPASGPPPEPFAFPPPGISAIGSGSVRVPQHTRRTQAAISRAVAEAGERATPRAVNAAKRRALAIAAERRVRSP